MTQPHLFRRLPYTNVFTMKSYGFCYWVSHCALIHIFSKVIKGCEGVRTPTGAGVQNMERFTNLRVILAQGPC